MPHFGPDRGGVLTSTQRTGPARPRCSNDKEILDLELLLPGEAVVSEGEGEMVRAGANVPVGLCPGLLVDLELLGVVGHVDGELLDQGATTGQHHLPVPEGRPGSVQGLGAVLLNDLGVAVPLRRAPLVFVEEVEENPTPMSLCEGPGGVGLRKPVDDAAVHVEPLHQVVELGEVPGDVQPISGEK